MRRSLCALVAAAVVLGACGEKEDRTRATGPAAVVEGPRSPFQGGVMPPGIEAPRFALRDEDGRLVRMADAIRRGPAIVTFLFTTCNTTCPLLLQQIRGALDDLGRDVPVIAVSLDPPRDTAARVRRFLLRHGVRGRVRAALGTRKELAPVWEAFAIKPEFGDLQSQARIVLVDRRGLQRVGYPAGQGTPEQLAADMRVLKRE